MKEVGQSNLFIISMGKIRWKAAPPIRTALAVSDFADVPEGGEPRQNALQIGAVGGRLIIHAERYHRQIDEGLPLDLDRDGLLRGEVGSLEPVVAKLLETVAFRPAEITR